MRTDTAYVRARAHDARVLSYDDLLAQRASLEAERRSFEALLCAEQDRARVERERRELAEEQCALAERQLAELRKSYAIALQELELLRRRIYAAKAERVDASQLELELDKTKAALDELQSKLEQAAAESTEPSAPPSAPPAQKRKPTGRRKLDESVLPVERVEISDHGMELLVASGEAEVVGSDWRHRACARGARARDALPIEPWSPARRLQAPARRAALRLAHERRQSFVDEHTMQSATEQMAFAADAPAERKERAAT